MHQAADMRIQREEHGDDLPIPVVLKQTAPISVSSTYHIETVDLDEEVLP
jgi:hypothetical protein